jgi:hypothetical protein
MRAWAPKAAMKRMKAVLKATGSSTASTRLKVSWLGTPCSKGMNWRNRSSRFLANSTISVQWVAPQSTAASAMNKISGNSCCAVKSRGSGTSLNTSRKTIATSSRPEVLHNRLL